MDLHNVKNGREFFIYLYLQILEKTKLIIFKYPYRLNHTTFFDLCKYTFACVGIKDKDLMHWLAVGEVLVGLHYIKDGRETFYLSISTVISRDEINNPQISIYLQPHALFGHTNTLAWVLNNHVISGRQTKHSINPRE